MIVMKFGGSSVADAERIKHVASIIQAYENERPLVILSAMGDTTDHLLEAADLAVTERLTFRRLKNITSILPEIWMLILLQFKNFWAN